MSARYLIFTSGTLVDLGEAVNDYIQRGYKPREIDISDEGAM